MVILSMKKMKIKKMYCVDLIIKTVIFFLNFFFKKGFQNIVNNDITKSEEENKTDIAEYELKDSNIYKMQLSKITVCFFI